MDDEADTDLVDCKTKTRKAKRVRPTRWHPSGRMMQTDANGELIHEEIDDNQLILQKDESFPFQLILQRRKIFPFLDLSGEIRNIVYRSVVQSLGQLTILDMNSTRGKIASKRNLYFIPALVLTNRQIAVEFRSMIFKEADFRVNVNTDTAIQYDRLLCVLDAGAMPRRTNARGTALTNYKLRDELRLFQNIRVTIDAADIGYYITHMEILDVILVTIRVRSRDVAPVKNLGFYVEHGSDCHIQCICKTLRIMAEKWSRHFPNLETRVTAFGSSAD